MANQPSVGKSVLIKSGVGAIVGGILVGVGQWLGFPPVFLAMFFTYALLGAIVFILLDAPPLKPLSGIKAAVTLVLFYAVMSGVYIGGASLWPQYDPQDEQGKIEKLLKRRLESVLRQRTEVDVQLERVQALESKMQSLTARLNRVAPPPAPQADLASAKPAKAMTLVERGREVYDLYECYNCHKIGGKGSVKKRGPVLDNIGNLLTITDIKKKIFDPTYLYAEGFEKEHKKGRMPDKYKDIMDDEELNALAAYLSTLKNAAVPTPRPVFVKTKVEHGFTVYGYVTDTMGKALPGVQVNAKPMKKHAHGGSAKTNQEGYYEIFLHMHNEDAGTTVTVSGKGVHKEIVADYDPNDKVTRRQASVDLTVGS